MEDKGVSYLQLAGSGILALFVLLGCTAGRSGVSLTDIPFDVSNRYVYQCEGDYRFSVFVREDSVALRYGTETTTLAQVEAESGARYSRGDMTFWTHGMEAILQTPTRSLTECEGQFAATPWAESALLGYDFRAVGQEPGWVVEIDHQGGMHLLTDYGETRILVPSTPDRVVESANTRSYTVTADSHDIRVVIVDERCEDPMSGESLPNTVTLRLDGRDYAGCGTSIESLGRSPLAGQRWLLTELGARLPPLTSPGQRAYIEFDIEGSRVFAFGGCNSVVAPYTMIGNQLLFRPLLAITSLTCLGSDVERQERDLQRVLRGAIRYAIVDRTLRFYSGNQEVAVFTAAER